MIRRSTKCNWFIRIFLVSAFFLITPMCFGQMGSYAIYSDVWGDGYENTNLYGCGITQDYSNYYNHSYWVVSTITSPAGRTVSATSYTSSSYARVDLSMPLSGNDFNDNDLGLYNMVTRHWLNCPYMGFAYPSGTTTAKVKVGISTSCFYFFGFDSGDCFYRPISPCDVKCRPDNILLNPNQAQCLHWATELMKWTQNPDTGTVHCPERGLARFSENECPRCFDVEVAQ